MRMRLSLLSLGLVILCAGAWSVAALSCAGPSNDVLRTVLAASFGFFSLAAVVAACLRRWWVPAAYGVAFAALLAWFFGIEPSNDRDWQTDVSLLSYATIDRDIVTVHNIRNFEYRSETEYTPAYYDKQFDLRRLEGVDLVAVYWMGPAIAHILLSFAFAGGDYLAVSIETRKEKGEGYSTLKGFFRQYELVYVVADERDVIRVRTNYRRDPPEEVFVYRLQGPIENARHLFMSYMNRINSLKATPEFYNTLTTNCTTNIWLHSRTNPGHPPLSWKILVSGYVPQYLYESGRLDTSVPFAELERRAHVNVRAQAADGAADFSRRIRQPSVDQAAGWKSESGVGLHARLRTAAGPRPLEFPNKSRERGAR